MQTRLHTDEGELGFQDYFVKRRCEPRVLSIRFEGAGQAAPAPGVTETLAADSLEAIVICPSNPYLSVDPILAIPPLRRALEKRRVPLVVVSPLIAGKAVKGPTAKIMGELAIAVTPQSIFAHYRSLADVLVVDGSDAERRIADFDSGLSYEYAHAIPCGSITTRRVRPRLRPPPQVNRLRKRGATCSANDLKNRSWSAPGAWNTR